jgi:hypothetical protein
MVPERSTRCTEIVVSERTAARSKTARGFYAPEQKNYFAFSSGEVHGRVQCEFRKSRPTAEPFGSCDLRKPKRSY